MSGAIFFSNSGGSVTAPPATAYTATRVGAAVTATVTYNTNGSVSVDPGLGVTTTNTTHNWFNPSVAGVGNAYFLRITPTVGSLTTNAASAYTALSSALAITRAAGAGVSQSCTYTVDIATDSGGVNVVSTQTGNTITADGT